MVSGWLHFVFIDDYLDVDIIVGWLIYLIESPNQTRSAIGLSGNYSIHWVILLNPLSNFANGWNSFTYGMMSPFWRTVMATTSNVGSSDLILICGLYFWWFGSIIGLYFWWIRSIIGLYFVFLIRKWYNIICFHVFKKTYRQSAAWLEGIAIEKTTAD